MVQRMQALKNTCQQFNVSLNQIQPTLITLRNEELKIIAVMSSNADDWLYGYPPEGAGAVNSRRGTWLDTKGYC